MKFVIREKKKKTHWNQPYDIEDILKRQYDRSFEIVQITPSLFKNYIHLVFTLMTELFFCFFFLFFICFFLFFSKRHVREKQETLLGDLSFFPFFLSFLSPLIIQLRSSYFCFLFLFFLHIRYQIYFSGNNVNTNAS